MKRYLTAIVCWLAAAFGLAAIAHAQPPEVPDVRILIDVSGSMKDNDPNNLRRPALRLLVGLLPKDARAGVWTFGQYVNMQVPLGRVDDDWRRRARAGAGKIHSRGQFTNVEEALKRATADWKGAPEGHQRHLVLLTDGMVDVSKDAAQSARSRERILNEQLPRLRRLGAKIHTVALSERADHALMRALSEDSGGWYEQVNSADQLQRVFLRIFEQVGNPDTVPLKDNGFQVDKSISEVTLLVFRPADAAPTRVVMPSGQEFREQDAPPNVRWHQDQGYDLLTISEPMAGEWKVQAQSDPDNRAMILTDLRMTVSELPKRLVAGQQLPLTVQFQEQGETIQRKAFIDMMQVAATQVGPGGAAGGDLKLADDGKGDDPMAYDGSFEVRFQPRGGEGNAQLIVSAEGRTFSREKRRIFELKLPARASLEAEAADQPDLLRLRVTPVAELIDPASLAVSAELETEDGGHVPVVLERRDNYSHQGALDLKQVAGKALLQIRLEARTPDGVAVATELPALEVQGRQPPQPEPGPEVAQPPAQPETAEPVPDETGEEGWTGAILFGAANLLLVLGGVGVWLVLRRRARRDVVTLVDEEEETGQAQPDEKEDAA